MGRGNPRGRGRRGLHHGAGDLGAGGDAPVRAGPVFVSIQLDRLGLHQGAMKHAHHEELHGLDQTIDAVHLCAKQWVLFRPRRHLHQVSP